jgi:hypothetical protein
MWNKTQAEHVTAPVRETGLYELCFKKRSGSSRDFTVYYSFDFISTGSPHMLLYPNSAVTLDKTASETPLYTMMQLKNVKGVATKIGLVDYSLLGVSPSVLSGNTRVQLLVTVDSVSKKRVDISVAKYPKDVEYPISWDSMGSYAKNGEYKQHVFDSAYPQLGDHMAFDVTEIFSEAVNSGKTQLAFTVRRKSKQYWKPLWNGLTCAVVHGSSVSCRRGRRRGDAHGHVVHAARLLPTARCGRHGAGSHARDRDLQGERLLAQGRHHVYQAKGAQQPQRYALPVCGLMCRSHSN